MAVTLVANAASSAPKGETIDPPVVLSQSQPWPPPPTPPTPSAQPAAPVQPSTQAPRSNTATPGKPGAVTLPPISAQAPPAAGFADGFGRFTITLPSGTEQLNATYNFALPASNLQINLSVAPRDAVFQTSLQTFPDMMRQSGALNVGTQQFDYRGRQATMVVVRLRDPQGATMQSINVFIPGANIWLQVNGPEQNARLVEDTMQSLLQNIQHR
jgi:hypothetical protein